MKKKTIFALLLALTLAAAPACLLSGCSGKTVYLADDNVTVITEEQRSQLDAQKGGSSGGTQASDGTGTTETTSTPAASTAPAAETPAASTAPAESSAETPAESSEETPAESSEEAPAADKIVITFVKPEKWEAAYALVYEEGKNVEDAETKKNGSFPGAEMTDNGDGTYSYEVPSDIPNPVVLFSDGKEGPNQWPRVNPLPVENGKTYQK